MASPTTTETTPLIPPAPIRPQGNPAKASKNVTFNPETSVAPQARHAQLRPQPATNPTSPPSQQHAQQPMLSALNSKLRRRNSQGSPLANSPLTPMTGPKIGAQRTTKTAQKLKLLPDPEHGEDGPDEESGRDVYSQFTRIKDPTARRDAARLGKADRDRLPRVTAYCTANAYRLDGLMKFLKSRGKTRGAMPKQFDECIYSPYDYGKAKNVRSTMEGPPKDHFIAERERRKSDSALEVDENSQSRREELMDLTTEAGDTAIDTGDESAIDRGSRRSEVLNPDFDTEVHTPEVFLFEYGTVVIWGMTLAQEKRFLKDIAKFETEKLSEEDVQVEDFNFYYTREYQARIYNDFISLREKRNYMTKLAISHALAQSVKTGLYEDLLSSTIEVTTPIPAQLATNGVISLSRNEINKKIGELFILRINIHLQGSVLDSPELMWAEPQLEPVYQAMRSYLEMDQRVGLLMERLDVLGDLLAVLKDQVRTVHGEALEWIVIVLIAAEIIVAAINIVVDLYAGVD